MLSAKCIQYCIAHHGTVDRSKEALRAALSFAKADQNTPGIHKIPRALHAFKNFATPEMVGEHKEALEALYTQYSMDNALTWAKGKNGAKDPMLYALEMLKHDVKNAEFCRKALEEAEEDNSQIRNVYVAEKTFNRLFNLG